ncbi:transcription factor IIA, alpha/beta subunit [Gonapodya prolifera JEL478]|uniref:Transcription initiation factor IIA large subunit n=1 Tax=Gonapodya prolifera (strain JEL478) TaxID=1344416 RepID=A0A139AIP1_GONPJ|nr:transcription factor IIA, alpha/beta subunit [Gonapodya prolifera JEL478]|eukprot:KXS16275.1 transcription factor IIA, alpha/beta subunit [Gonapodya prolifera JEL478]
MASMNQIVLSVYKTIIEDVIDKIRPEFANVGIEENVLHELQMTWENKVMNSGVANFPADFVSGAEFVDPAPAQAEAITQPAAAPQLQLPNGQITLAQLSKLYAQQTAGGAAAGPAGNARQASASSSTPFIKSEFGGYRQAGPQPAQRPPVPSQMAYAQAQNILQQQTSASGTLNPQLLQYIQLAQQKQQQQRRFPQVDGPTDVDAGDEGYQEDTVEDGVETYSLNRETADLAFNRQAASIYAQRSRETAELRAALVAGGGAIDGETSGEADGAQASAGLVRGRKKDRRRCKLHANSALSDEGNVATTASTSAHQPAIPQVDGDVNEDEEEEDDGADGAGSDGIGSDLDSDSSGDEAEESDLCLCQYDKVQRTRNKWRCGFRDGVLSVAGKDYLFHRANGDFEW